jgi:alpha-ketoglutarate-dependent taurine dioxygenase
VISEPTRQYPANSGPERVSEPSARDAAEDLSPEFFNAAQLPAVVRPTRPDRAGPGTVAALLARPEARVLLKKHGAILFRGFGLSGLADFDAVVEAHYGRAVSVNVGGLSPRGALLQDRIYESTRFPSSLRLHQHNEYSHMANPPRDLFFYCDQPSETGGETPLSDSRRILAEVPEPIRREFEVRGVRYQRHYYGRFWFPLLRLLNRFVRLHRPWQEALGARTRDEAAARCKELGLSLRWLWDGSATVACRLPALARHPDTGEPVWFNQSTLQQITPKVYGWPRFLGFRLMYPLAKLRPFHAAFGDGGRIPMAHLYRILEATDRATVSFPWQAGDLLWIDNFLVAHGRMPYKGQRRIMVALGPRVNASA